MIFFSVMEFESNSVAQSTSETNSHKNRKNFIISKAQLFLYNMKNRF